MYFFEVHIVLTHFIYFIPYLDPKETKGYFCLINPQYLTLDKVNFDGN